ncbi:futalosine hydrolase [Flavihumibacter sp. R14]|nr:futalosine hydrolase [Flavihumibacter soli]
MKILLVAATRAECQPLVSRYADSRNPARLTLNNTEAEILVTGVGMVATAFALGRHLSETKYDLAVNMGIAGSFNFDLSLGEVVQITQDVFAELGAEDGDDFLSLNELGFGEVNQYAVAAHQESHSPRLNGANLRSLDQLKKVKAITVNKVHGNELTIARTLSRYDAQVESMEGAAFFYACNQTQTPCLQVRAISNYVERRNKEKWNIGLAVKNLNDFLYSFLATG